MGPNARLGLFVGGALVVSAAVALLLTSALGDQAVVENDDAGTREEATSQVHVQGDAVPARVNNGPAEGRTLHDLSLSTITVVEAAGSPIAGAELIPATVEKDVVLRSDDAVARSSAGGVIRVDPKGGIASFYVYGRDYVPTFVRDLSKGEDRRVELIRAAKQEFRFETVDGVPVRGLSATVSSRSLTSRESMLAGEGHFFSLPGEFGSVASTGISDATGGAHVSLTVPGTYWLRVNLGQSGYVLSNSSECIQVSIPGPTKVVKLNEIIGAAVQFVGARVLGIRRSRKGPSPFGKPRSVPEMVPVKNAKQRLQKTFGDARIFLGVRRDGARPLGTLELIVLKDSGETERVDVPLQRLTEIRKPQIVKLKSEISGQNSLVTFRYAQTGKGHLESDALPQIWVRIIVAGERFTVRCRAGEPVVLPRGELYVMPEKNVLDGGFATVKLDLKEEHREVVLPLNKRLHRYNLRILLPNGKSPQRCSVGLRRMMMGRQATSSIYVLEGRITFWTARAELKVKVDTRGCKTMRTVLDAGAGEKIDGETWHAVRMESDL